MSGKPSILGVERFTNLLDTMVQADLLASSLAKNIEQDQKALIEAQEKYTKAKNELFSLTKSMDIEASGNYGYENRMSWFLVELYKQIKGRI